MTELEALIASCAAQVRATGLNCPLPLLKTKKALAKLRDGERVYLCATDPGSMRDLTAYAAEAGHAVVYAEQLAEVFHCVLAKHGAHGQPR